MNDITDATQLILKVAPFGGQDAEGSGSAGNDGSTTDTASQPESNAGAGQAQSETTTPSEDDDDDEFNGYSTKELRRIARDLASSKKSAEKDRDSFKSKIDEQERKNRTDEENLRNDLHSANERISTLASTNARLAITTAIICDSRYQWHNPEIVAQQFSPDEVQVDDNGKVIGLKKALDRVSKEHAYLLKTQQGQQNTGPTGFQPGQGAASSGTSINQDAKELAKTYPALASRL